MQIAALFDIAHDSKDHPLIVAQKAPVSFAGVQGLQFAGHQLHPLLIAVTDIVDKAALKADAHPQCMMISTRMQVDRMARKSLAEIPSLMISP